MFRCAGFGLVFAWIVFGSYGRRKAVADELEEEEADRLSSRRLLGIDSTSSDEVSTGWTELC